MEKGMERSWHTLSIHLCWFMENRDFQEAECQPINVAGNSNYADI